MNHPVPGLLPPTGESRSRIELLRRASTNLYGSLPALLDRSKIREPKWEPTCTVTELCQATSSQYYPRRTPHWAMWSYVRRLD
jgi:hypothetical protein